MAKKRVPRFLRNVNLPPGPKGDKGDPGPQGPKGDPGEVTQAELDAAVADLQAQIDELKSGS